ncbi:hypothetical protein BBJ29_005607 [Phytophthora kernoviae]|uniref:Heme haloperoxidase family profile domain-containing protein n=1 Tax=Phytophthora kernoviae TaxID=325452 RepID=A0A3F2RHW3_9STRA|nr:hypothetical protein BBP00_00007555 [Phytophthora kernoviae]RLN71799.1 hypothetical protein BBJ29_005607 [Phytophthora kernoviae]
MVSFIHSAVAAAVATTIAASPAVALEEGEYFRPSNGETSGINGTTAVYRRSPCPALNALANHGYLPRDGQNITHDMLITAIKDVYNVGNDVGELLVADIPTTSSLDNLGIHNLIEHDASLVHTDAYYGYDPMLVNETLAEDLFARAGYDGLLTNTIVAETRRDRGNTCNAENPECTYGVKAQTLAFLEASALLTSLGTGDNISVEHAHSFIINEKIPDDYTTPDLSVLQLSSGNALPSFASIKFDWYNKFTVSPSAAMVSFIQSVVVAVAAVVFVASPSAALSEGEYFRPSNDETSGIYGTSAAYRRSPCPALNTLANHGYLPRDGHNITHDMLRTALMNVYNLGSGVVDILVANVPDTITLDYLGLHNIIEHDASLAHTDAYYGHDPMIANETLAEGLFARAGDDGVLTNRIVAATRKERGKMCNAENPECTYGVKAQTLAFLEASVLLMALGTGNTISVEHARSFIMNEKIPDDYTTPKSTISVVSLLARAATLKAMSLV